MKKVFKSILLLVALCLPLLEQRVNADVTEEPLQVIVQHQFENPDGSELVYGADIALSLYDISDQYHDQKTPADAKKFIESFSQLSAQQLRRYLVDNKIQKVETVTTDATGKAYFKVAGNDNAYLIVQDHAVKGQTILPLAFSLPLQNEDGTPKNIVELYTKPYADNYEHDREAAVAPFVEASRTAHRAGLGVNAGHDLNLSNLEFFASRLPYLNEVSIGHAVICDALYLGIESVIKAYRKALEVTK